MKKLTRKEIEILKKIKGVMKNTETKCRDCGEGEGNNHNEGIHTINSILHNEIKI